uniref:ATPase, P-type (Transporting), HAD superfamily, subfamily IC n=1 Tax=Caulobacter sp. (strain K31) TaxID=366602 RepID=B0SYG6_CAUSK
MTVELLRGLDEAEAAERLAAVGPNELPHARGRTVFHIIGETLREPMFLLLVGAAVLYLALGDLGEGLFLTAGALASVGLVVMQEARSERALNALRDLSQPLARVLRGGEERQIPARDLAPDDLLLIGEGERLPADARLIAGEVLAVDESALTGESAPVTKPPATGDETPANPTPGVDGAPDLFAGTLVVRGQGVARITRTGPRSALGQIGASLAAIEHQPTPLQKTAGRLVGWLGAMAIGFCLLVTAAYGWLRDDWVGGVLAGITVAISLIPEEFPMVLAVFLALGAWRLATHQVLTRRSAVIETLGGATVLCVDKTGTLTENQMRVARLWTKAGEILVEEGRPIDGPAGALLELAALASAVRPIDPMDRAVRHLSAGMVADGEITGVEPERAWPLRPDLLAVVQVWRGAGEQRIAAAKGAPEAIFSLCKLPAVEIAHLQAVVEDFAQKGLRVLGVASARVDGDFADDPRNEVFAFAGLIGFVDPLRRDVPAALAEARAAGVAVIMITGDHPATALATARMAGLDVSAGVLLGSEIVDLPFATLCERLRGVRVFARVAPAQKLRLVEALKADGEIVAMTGDGVNDAPALEAAHIGVAMGKKGTDVAREAADLVLLDDSFASIVGGVRLGRRIFTNLRRALTYVTAIHVPIAGLALAPILLGLPPLLFPMHVVLMELAIDPICALVFEAEPSDAQAMRRPPRRPDEPLFGLAQIGQALLQGLVVLAGVLGVYVWALQGHTQAQARGAAFGALVLANLILALTDAAASGALLAPHRRAFWTIAAGIVALLATITSVPLLAAVFKVATPDPLLLAVVLLTAMFSGGWMAAVSRFRAMASRTAK